MNVIAAKSCEPNIGLNSLATKSSDMGSILIAGSISPDDSNALT